MRLCSTEFNIGSKRKKNELVKDFKYHTTGIPIWGVTICLKYKDEALLKDWLLHYTLNRLLLNIPSLYTLKRNVFPMQANDGILTFADCAKFSLMFIVYFKQEFILKRWPFLERGSQCVNAGATSEHSLNHFLYFTDGNKKTQWSKKFHFEGTRAAEVTGIERLRFQRGKYKKCTQYHQSIHPMYKTGDGNVLYFDGGVSYMMQSFLKTEYKLDISHLCISIYMNHTSI